MAQNDPTDPGTDPERDPTVHRPGEHSERSARIRSDTQQYAYRLLTLAALVLLATGTVVYRWLEGWTWIDSFYFSSIAVTTVGFGDLVPTTDGAKVFTVAYVFSGIAVITSFLNVRLKRHARAIATNRKALVGDGSPNDTEREAGGGAS